MYATLLAPTLMKNLFAQDICLGFYTVIPAICEADSYGRNPYVFSFAELCTGSLSFELFALRE